MTIRRILGSLGRSLMRYSEVPATSAPPQIAHDAPKAPPDLAEVQRRIAALGSATAGKSREEVTAMLRDTFKDMPHVKIGGAINLDPVNETEQEYYNGLQVSPDSGTPIDAPPILWENIAKIRQDILRGDFPDWSLTKFATRNRHTRYACWMMGVTRGVFGVYNRSFYCCEPINDERVLSALIHLPTGTGMGLFMTNEAARSAAEIAMSLPGIEWIGSSSVDVTNISAKNDGDLIYRLRTAWQAAGIVPAPYHAHDNSDEQLYVHMQTYASTTANRPEKLS